MTAPGDDRQEIRGVAAAQNPVWQILPDGAKDLFHRGMHDVEVHYDTSDTATLAVHKFGGPQYRAVPGVGSAKAAAIGWLTSTKPDQV